MKVNATHFNFNTNHVIVIPNKIYKFNGKRLKDDQTFQFIWLRAYADGRLNTYKDRTDTQTDRRQLAEKPKS